MTRAAVVALGRPTFDLDQARRLVDAAVAALDRGGFELRVATTIATDVDALTTALAEVHSDDGFDVMIVLQATFADSSMIIRLHEQVAAPVVCWSFPEPRTGDSLRLNALCGANLAAYALRRRGSDAAFVHVEPDACDALERVRAAIDRSGRPLTFEWPPDAATTSVGEEPSAAADRAAAVLRESAVGVIGDRPDGFEPCGYDPVTVAELTGAVTDRIEIADLFAAADAVPAVELPRIRRRFEERLELLPELDDHGLDKSFRLYGALRSLAAERGWDAVATRCWPECTRDYGGAACAPQAMMSEDGIPAMCEADVYGGLTALVLRTVSGSDVFVTDVVDIDRDDGTSAIWHCGQAPTTLAAEDSERVGIIHPMQGKALLNQFTLRPGRVTVARITQARDRTAMVIGGGELISSPRPYAGTCGVLKWDLPVDDVMGTVFEVGLEHHVAIVAGDHRDALVELAGLWEIPVIRLGHDRGRRMPRTFAPGIAEAVT